MTILIYLAVAVVGISGSLVLAYLLHVAGQDAMLLADLEAERREVRLR
jgi:hypothetical protein